MTLVSNQGPFAAGTNIAILDSMWQRFNSVFWRDAVFFGQLNQMNVTAGTGLQIQVDTGLAVVIGIWCYNDAQFAINLATADPTNPRIDNIVIHVNRTASTDSAGVAAFTAALIAITGTPAGGPVAPAVTQNSSTWEMSLNNVRVNALATVPSTFTDTRNFGPNWPIVYQQGGVAENGVAGGQQKAVTAGDVFGVAKDFKRRMQKTPTSITLTGITRTNATVQTATSIQDVGFLYNWTGTASGLTTSYDTYATVGNCLRAIGPNDFDIHCDGCDQVHHRRSLKSDLQVIDLGNGTKPGALGLRHECPDCGTVECFNTALRGEDERLVVDGWEQRMEQAYLIRQAQDQLRVPMLT
jgi:hypothetical protein